VEGGGQAGAVVGDGVENRIDVGVGMEIGRGAGVVTRPKFALVLEFMHGVFKLGFQVGVVKLGRSFWIVQVEVFQSRCSPRVLREFLGFHSWMEYASPHHVKVNPLSEGNTTDSFNLRIGELPPNKFQNSFGLGTQQQTVIISQNLMRQGTT
jgi:hypothetical protein